jgi:hypothetical protein
VEIGRCQQIQAGMMVLLVVPREELLTEMAGMRKTVCLDYAEIGQQQG